MISIPGKIQEQDIHALIQVGYCLVSNKFLTLARIDRENWREYMAQRHAPWDVEAIHRYDGRGIPVSHRRPNESARAYRLRYKMLCRDLKKCRRRRRQIAAIHRVGIDKRLIRRLRYGCVTIYADGRVVRSASMLDQMVRRIHEAPPEVLSIYSGSTR